MKIRGIILKRQLKKSGSDPAEAKTLSKVSNNIDKSVPHISKKAKSDIANQIGFNSTDLHKRHRFELAGAFIFALVITLASQTASPGSPLYALKRGTEEIIVKVKPSFKNDLIDRRQGELDSLRNQKAENDSIKRAEDEYRKSLERSGSYERKTEEENKKQGSENDDFRQSKDSSNIESDQQDKNSSGSGTRSEDSSQSGSEQSEDD